MHDHFILIGSKLPGIIRKIRVWQYASSRCSFNWKKKKLKEGGGAEITIIAVGE